jgi:hypothetical protein
MKNKNFFFIILRKRGSIGIACGGKRKMNSIPLVMCDIQVGIRTGCGKR